MSFLLSILAIVILFPFVSLADFDLTIDKDTLKTSMELEGNVVNDADKALEDEDGVFVNVNWQVNWTEEKDRYLVSVVLSEEDLPSKVHVDIIDSQIKISLGKKIKFIRVPNDVDLVSITHKTIEDKIKFILPKKKLKSII